MDGLVPAIPIRTAQPLSEIAGTSPAMTPRGSPMPNAIEEACYPLALANRIVAHEGVLDGFGHMRIRTPADPGRYLLARSRSPELIEPTDILEFSLDSKLLTPTDQLPYGECVIHGCIYQLRPDVDAES